MQRKLTKRIHQGDGAKKLQGFAETTSCDEHQYKKEFYCETCQELICRFCSLRDDHESHHYVTVEEASAKFKHDLNDKLQLLNTDLVKIDQNLMSISQAEQTFSSRVTQALGVVQDRAARAMKEVEAEEKRVLDELKQREKDNGQTLEEKRKILLELQKQKLHTLAVAEAANQEDFSSIFLVRYTDIRMQLQKRGCERPPKSDVKLVYPTFQRSQNIGAVDLGKVVMEDTWELCHEFGKQGQGVGEFETARGVAAAAEPDEIAVTDWKNRRFVICNNQGGIKGYISGDSDDVTIMPDGWVVASQRDVKVYTRYMTLAYEFKTVAESEVGKTEVRLVSVTVMQNGDIIAGDIKRKVLTQHQSGKRGKLIRTIPVSIRPDFLSVLSNGWIVISDYEEGLAGIVDVSDGKAAEVATVRPTIDGDPVNHCAGVCSNSSGIYLVVSTGFVNSGHVHHYDDLGQFVSCVAQGLYNPTGIAFTADGQQLAVADLHSVKIYHKV
ncbi:tripartite motif-containing protein 3-like [Patiria miniata]|uniref:B box-type domain-containing protein n=1 Tax=Patiria miniata TaxID=46514 RepID=A0A914AMW7_PATMI|nr:tripartite motif-containing protein 3-like [Patiria miniata]